MSKKKDLGLKSLLRDADPEERAAILAGLPYDTGFGKPPQHTQFTSANQPTRRGRPKGSENLSTILADELATQVDVTEGGKRRRKSKQRVIITQIINQAASGNLKASSLLIDMQRKSGLSQLSQAEAVPVFDERDRQTMHRLVEALNGSPATGADDQGGKP